MAWMAISILILNIYALTPYTRRMAPLASGRFIHHRRDSHRSHRSGVVFEKGLACKISLYTKVRLTSYR